MFARHHRILPVAQGEPKIETVYKFVWKQCHYVYMNYTELMVWRHIVQHITAGIQVCVETCGNEMSDLPIA